MIKNAEVTPIIWWCSIFSPSRTDANGLFNRYPRSKKKHLERRMKKYLSTFKVRVSRNGTVSIPADASDELGLERIPIVMVTVDHSAQRALLFTFLRKPFKEALTPFPSSAATTVRIPELLQEAGLDFSHAITLDGTLCPREQWLRNSPTYRLVQNPRSIKRLNFSKTHPYQNNLIPNICEN